MDNPETILTITAIIGAIVLLVLFYRYYKTMLELDRLTNKPKRRRFAFKHKGRHPYGTSPADNMNSATSNFVGCDVDNTDASNLDGSASDLIGGGGEFGGAGATGGWGDAGGGSDK